MKIIILDRDGVINQDSEDYVKSPAEWLPLPGSLEAISRLNQLGYKVVIATNQSGIGRGMYDVAMLNLIHAKMQRMLSELDGHIDDVFYCPHLPAENCLCRKPKIGLLQQISEKYSVNLSGIPFVGDSWRDIEAALEAGCRPVLVRTGNGAGVEHKAAPPVEVFDDLADFVATIYAQRE